MSDDKLCADGYRANLFDERSHCDLTRKAILLFAALNDTELTNNVLLYNYNREALGLNRKRGYAVIVNKSETVAKSYIAALFSALTI